MAIIQSKTDLENLRYSCRILMSCFEHTGKLVKGGADCGEINAFAINFMRKYGGEPSFLNYDGYKYGVCISIDNEVAHGIAPFGKKIPDKSIVKLDMGVIYKGMFSDSCITYVVGKVEPKIVEFVNNTKTAMMAGVNVVKAGARLGDIGSAVDSVAKEHGYGNVSALGGHGVGYEVHGAPFVANQGVKGKGERLFENQVICIEPMLTMGKGDVIFDNKKSDGWTVRTRDNSIVAQFEHEVLVTKKGFEILTQIDEKDILPL